MHASPGQTESQVDPSFQLASTRESVWPRLKVFYKEAILVQLSNCEVPLKENKDIFIFEFCSLMNLGMYVINKFFHY